MIRLATLRPQPPYNFPLLLDFLSRFAYPTLDITRDSAYWRALRVGDGLALVCVTGRGSLDEPELDVHLAASTGEIDTAAALEALAQVMPLDTPQAFYDFARSDERLWGVVEPLLGLPDLRCATLFEALMQTVIEQQIAWVAAQKAQRWLVEWANNTIAHDGQTYYAFPSPDQLMKATVDDLKPLKITFKRMALMIDIASRVNAGALDLEGVRAFAPHDAYQHLLQIKGIGHWTAVVALERAYGYDGWIAHNDVVLQSATNRYFYGGQGRILAEQVTETFTRYGAFAGLAARYTMFRWVLEQYPQQPMANVVSR